MAFLRFHLIQGSSYHCKGDHVYQMTSMMSLHLLYRLLVSLQGRDNAYQQYCLLICPPPPFGLLTSTVNLQQHNVFCPPRPIENTVDNTLVSHNVSQVSSDSRLETTEEHVDNVIESVTDTSAEDSGPSWGETPVGVHPSAEESVIDPVPRCHLELYNQQEPYYYRTIAPKKALYALCQETERNNIMTYNRDMMSYTCLDIDKCDVFDE